MIWNTIMFVGEKSSGKTSILNFLLDKDDPILPSQSVEYQYIKKKDFISQNTSSELIVELYTCEYEVTEMLVQQSRTYIIVLVIDLSSNIDFTNVKLLKDQFPELEYLVIGTKLDEYSNMKKEDQKLIMSIFQLSCKSLKIPFLFTSINHPLHQKYTKNYLFYKSGLANSPPDTDFEDFKPVLEIAEFTAKQAKSLEQLQSKVKIENNNEHTVILLEPEADVDSYCLRAQNRLSILLEEDKKEFRDRIEDLSKDSQYSKKWEDIFALMN
eukprot:NODE_693_length_5110_cov_0.285572.p1 type:complete len:269 gc:universal NODE_693_length_5110_cov_0.285572:673-1479(+)